MARLVSLPIPGAAQVPFLAVSLLSPNLAQKAVPPCRPSPVQALFFTLQGFYNFAACLLCLQFAHTLVTGSTVMLAKTHGLSQGLKQAQLHISNQGCAPSTENEPNTAIVEPKLTTEISPEVRP